LLPADFGPYPISTTLDGSGNGQVAFQAVGQTVRITNGFAGVSTQTAQATATAYKGIVGAGYAISSTPNGSTGAPFVGPFNLRDGETLIIRWTGGDPGATATATFTGTTSPFNIGGPSSITWETFTVANDGTLIVNAIKSSNYVAGVSGWAVFRDGSYELGGNGTFRGNLSVVSPSGSSVSVFATATTAEIDMQPPLNTLNPGSTYTSGILYTTIDSSDRPVLRLQGPGQVTPVARAGTRISLLTGSSTTDRIVEITADTLSFPGNSILNTGTITAGASLTDIGLGLVTAFSDSADSATNSAEFVVLTLPSTTYLRERLYRVDITGRLAPSASCNPLMQLRKNNVAGAIVAVFGRVACPSAQEYSPPSSIYFQVGAANVTATLALTLDAGGTNIRHESANVGRSISVWDVTASPLSTGMDSVVTLT
jgi:hypothetical protein